MSQRDEAERDWIQRGYRQQTKASKCFACLKEFEWWRTPKGKLIPLTSDDLKPHKKICPEAYGNLRPKLGPKPYFRGGHRW